MEKEPKIQKGKIRKKNFLAKGTTEQVQPRTAQDIIIIIWRNRWEKNIKEIM